MVEACGGCGHGVRAVMRVDLLENVRDIAGPRSGGLSETRIGSVLVTVEYRARLQP